MKSFDRYVTPSDIDDATRMYRDRVNQEELEKDDTFTAYTRSHGTKKQAMLLGAS